MKKITIVGSGTMGNGIAHVFAMNDYDVSLFDISEIALEKAMITIEKNLDRMVAKETITADKKDITLQSIKTKTNLLEAVIDADLVVEAATENWNLKSGLFKDLDKNTKPECILASNTSSISITSLGAVTGRADKVIGMHFMNPVPVMKLVEIIRGFDTSNEVTQTIMELSKKLNKIPVEVNDYPGFVANRILMPMINEAIITLSEGVAGVEEIDQVMKLGMAHPMGPLQLADFIGLDVCFAILNVMYEGFLNPKYAPCQLLRKMVTAGKLGVKTKEGFYDYSAGAKDIVVAKSFRK